MESDGWRTADGLTSCGAFVNMFQSYINMYPPLLILTWCQLGALTFSINVQIEQVDDDLFLAFSRILGSTAV